MCWYHGSGERNADDVNIDAARKVQDSSPGHEVHDCRHPEFPDTNPVMFLDRDKRLWLLWQVILANEWDTA